MTDTRKLFLFSATWWKETETPRWAIMLGAVVMFALTVLSQHLLAERNRTNEHQAEQIQAFIDSAAQFQVFASTFSTEMFADKTVSTITRSKLIENLNDQITRIRTIEPIAPDEAKLELETYRGKVVSMIEVVNKTTDLVSMKDFWTLASELTVARNSLNRKLQAAI